MKRRGADGLAINYATAIAGTGMLKAFRTLENTFALISCAFLFYEVLRHLDLIVKLSHCHRFLAGPVQFYRKIKSGGEGQWLVCESGFFYFLTHAFFNISFFN